jgi:hypothetical protein
VEANGSWWAGLQIKVDSTVIAESGSRTFAVCELMVRVPWRKTGLSKCLHDELVNRRLEERATLLVEEAHIRVQSLYKTWGYRAIGPHRPAPNAPRYIAMIKNL